MTWVEREREGDAESSGDEEDLAIPASDSALLFSPPFYKSSKEHSQPATSKSWERENNKSSGILGN